MPTINTRLVEFIRHARHGAKVRNGTYSPADLPRSWIDERDDAAIQRYMNDEAELQRTALRGGGIVSIYVIHVETFVVQHWHVTVNADFQYEWTLVK